MWGEASHCTKAIEVGTRSQWNDDSERVVDMTHLTAPGKSMSWDDLTKEPLDPGEVRQARRLHIEYLRQLAVYRKVPASTAREGSHNISEALWVDARKADGTHRSRSWSQPLLPLSR